MYLHLRAVLVCVVALRTETASPHWIIFYQAFYPEQWGVDADWLLSAGTGKVC
jgi:hypothetical protein